MSEKRAVGSLRPDKDVSHSFPLRSELESNSRPLQSLVDLMGDESTPVVPSTKGISLQSTQDLLADIFGTSNDESVPSSSIAAAPAKSSVNDILGFFDSTSLTPQVTGGAVPKSSKSTASDLDIFSQSPSSTPTPVVSTKPHALETATAYESNGLKITLTPSKDPTKPNILLILARFTATAGEIIEGVSFQAAVPKVSPLFHFISNFGFAIWKEADRIGERRRKSYRC